MPSRFFSNSFTCPIFGPKTVTISAYGVQERNINQGRPVFFLLGNFCTSAFSESKTSRIIPVRARQPGAQSKFPLGRTYGVARKSCLASFTLIRLTCNLVFECCLNDTRFKVYLLKEYLLDCDVHLRRILRPAI